MHFIVYCIDKPGSLDLRLKSREAHLAYLRGSKVPVAGPMLDGDEGSPMGSLLIIEADNLEAARQWTSGDPYNKAGVFQSVEVRPWRWVIGAPA